MVITICGSMQYTYEILREYERLSLKGYLVYLPVFHADANEDFKVSNVLKEQLRQLHFKKILLSDSIFVVNPDGYIGEDTLAEIEYAKHCNVPVKYLKEE